MKKFSCYAIFLIMMIQSSLFKASNAYANSLLTPFNISNNNNNNNDELWISVNLMNPGSGKDQRYILANNGQPSVSGTQVLEMTTFLNNGSFVSATKSNNPNWQDGIIFNLFRKNLNSKQVYIAAYNANDTTTPLIVAELPGANWPSVQINWEGSFITGYGGKRGAYTQSSAVSGTNASVIYKAGQKITSSSVSTPSIPVVNSVFSPVETYSIGSSSEAISQIMISLGIASTNYAIFGASILAAGVPKLNDALYSTLQGLSVQDWNDGIYFSFIESDNKVSLYVQNVRGVKLAEVIIPGISYISNLQNYASFVASNGVVVVISPNKTFCFTLGNAVNHNYVRIPIKVNDTTFNPTLVSMVVQGKMNGLSKASDFWLTMTLNNNLYVLAKGSTSGNAPTGQTLQPYTTPGASSAGSTDIQTFLQSLTIQELQGVVYFNFITGNNKQLLLNVQVGNGQGLIAAGKYNKSQVYSLPGVQTIQGNVLFKGSFIFSPYLSISVYQTAAITASTSIFGPIYEFPKINK